MFSGGFLCNIDIVSFLYWKANDSCGAEIVGDGKKCAKVRKYTFCISFVHMYTDFLYRVSLIYFDYITENYRNN